MISKWVSDIKIWFYLQIKLLTNYQLLKLLKTTLYANIFLRDHFPLQLSRMTSWGDLSQAQMGYYIAFHLGGDEGHPDMPGNNTRVSRRYNPSEGEINAVSDTGDELVRTINYRLTVAQENAVRDWVFHHGTNHQIGRLIQPNDDPFEGNDEDENLNNIIEEINNINNINNNIIEVNDNIIDYPEYNII